MSHAEKHHKIHDGQWGSRKGRNSTDCVATKVFAYETARLTRASIIAFENDAKSCYDRIVMAFALLRCQFLGLPPAAAAALGRFLDTAEYHIKTSLGISEDFYKHSEQQPLHGPGQGSLEGPALWAIVSSGPMDMISDRFNGAQFHDPAKSLHTRTTVNGFVDYLGKTINAFLDELNFNSTTQSAQTQITGNLVEAATQMAQQWERALWSTGGKLEIANCFAYLTSWTFDDDGKPELITPPTTHWK